MPNRFMQKSQKIRLVAMSHAAELGGAGEVTPPPPSVDIFGAIIVRLGVSFRYYRRGIIIYFLCYILNKVKKQRWPICFDYLINK